MRTALSLSLVMLGLGSQAVAQCGPFGAHEVFIELYGPTTSSIDIYRATDGGTVAMGLGIYSRTGRCDWIWELDGDTGGGVNAADFTCTRGIHPCNDARGLYILIIDGSSYLYGPGGGATRYNPSFYFPLSNGSPDLGFAVIQEPNEVGRRVQAIALQPVADLSSLEYYENALPNGYVIPYDSQTAGAQGGDGYTPNFFLTKLTRDCIASRGKPSSCRTDPYAYDFAPEGDVRLPGAGPFVWDIPNVTLSFGPNSRLVVDKPLTITGGTLTASNPSQGWGGVRVTGGSATFASQSTIQRGGVTVTGGTFTLDRSAISNAPSNGIYATGSSSHVTVTNQSLIQQSGAVGIRAER